MLPWNERVAAISVNPDMASREDIARMAAELMEKCSDEDVERMKLTIEESHRLLRHYASLLNNYDGGARKIPEGVSEWIGCCIAARCTIAKPCLRCKATIEAAKQDATPPLPARAQ